MTSLRRPPSSLVFPAALRRWTRRIQANVALSLVTIPVSCCLRRRSRPRADDTRTVPTQRNVEIVPQPTRQRNVPPAPKLGDVCGEIRLIEIPHQVDTKQPTQTSRNIRVSGEITVDLKREEIRRQEQLGPAAQAWILETYVHDRTKGVRQRHLLEIADEDQLDPDRHRRPGDAPRSDKPGEQVRRPLDRTRDKLREVGHEQGKREWISCRLDPPAIDINGV